MDDTPPAALPQMSAMVEIDTGWVRGALVIPVESMAIVHGLKCCYVRARDGMVRRKIATGAATPNLLEVTGGLHEGERVISRFATVDGIPIQ
jgi:hypothetical protein